MMDFLEISNHREYLFCYLHKKFSKTRKEDLEDVVQLSLIKAYRFINQWKRNSSLKSWLTKIAINTYYDLYRNPQKNNEFLIDTKENLFLLEKEVSEDFSETFCDINYHNQLSKELFNGFEDNVHVQAFKMNIIDEIDYKDIAFNQNIPIGTVKSRIFRGKKLLQEKYREISYKYEETTV